MSILSRLFGKKEPTVVAEPEKKHWKHQKCAGSCKLALPSQEVREESGKKVTLGMCPKCGRLGIPTKNNVVAAHYPKASD